MTSEPADPYAVPGAATRPRTIDGLRILKRDRLIWLIFAGTIPFIIVLEGVNVAPTVAVLAVWLVLLGTFNGAANAAVGPLYVLRPADADRGKVLAAINGVSRAGSILALGLGGLVGGLLGPRVTFVGGAVCAMAVVSGLAWLLRGVDRAAPACQEVPVPWSYAWCAPEARWRHTSLRVALIEPWEDSPAV